MTQEWRFLDTMSSRKEQTHEAILEAAWKLLQGSSGEPVKLQDIAEQAGVSRQAVYLHFGSRGGLLLELVQHIDQKLGLVERIQKIREAPTPRAALMEYVRVTAEYAPSIHEVAMALDRQRHDDTDVASAFENRMKSRRSGLRQIVSGLHAADELIDGWSVDQVTDALWAVGTPRAYSDLVEERGWSADEFERWLLHAAHSFLKHG